MHPVQKHLFATDFKDLAGSRLEGTIALSDELINLGIMDFLAGLQKPASSPTSPAQFDRLNPSPAAAPETDALPDPKAILAKLDIKTLKLRAENGRILVDVDVAMKG
jgi:hypothetical protein